MIDILKSKKIKAKVAVADCLELPYKNASFDLVVGISLFHHIARKDREKFFKEMNRVLKKNGALVLSDPNKLNPGTSLYQAMQGEHAISRFEMKNLSEKAGFKVKKIGEILVRSPGTSNFLEKLPGWNLFEAVLEKLSLGVTVFLVAEKK
jgi:ubiquinone/menaquinone biosynthesis C-methylase UbiE